MIDNENLERALIYADDMSDNMVEHVALQMQSNFELSMAEDVSYLPDFQVKNYTYGSQGIYGERSCTQLLWSN